MARHKPIKITETPSQKEIERYWQDCFTPYTAKGRYNAVQDRVYRAYVGDNGNTLRTRYKALLKGGYLELVKPQTTIESGADEYSDIMKGQKTWVSIRKNSGS